MKKRGLIVAIAGAIMIVIAAYIAYSVMPQIPSDGSGADFFPSPESLFDSVSDKVTIDA